MNESSEQPGRRRSPLVVGLILIVVGAILLAVNLGWGLPLALWNFWPVFLILPGLVAIFTPSRHLTRSGGVWLVAWGVYCQISQLDLWGLGWFTAWPIFVIAYGLDIVIGKGLGCNRHAAEQDRVSHEG